MEQKIITNKNSKENYYKQIQVGNLIWHDHDMITER